MRETDRTGSTGLMYAAAANNRDIVQILVEAENCMRNHAGETALLIAAAHNAAQVIPILLLYEHEMVTLSGATALHIAVQHNSSESILLLLSRYSPVRDGGGFTAMEYCAHNNLLPQLSLLVKHGHYTIDDLSHAASIADSLSHKECAAALWRASGTYPGTSLMLSNLHVTTVPTGVPPNSAQDTDGRSLNATSVGSRSRLTLGQLESREQHSTSSPAPVSRPAAITPSGKRASIVLPGSGTDVTEDTALELRDPSATTSPSIFLGVNGSVLVTDAPVELNDLDSNPKSLDSSLTPLTSQLSGIETSTQRSEVRILVDHLRSALEQARGALKEKSITIVQLEDQIKSLVNDAKHSSSASYGYSELLSLREEVSYYKQLLAKRDIHEKELKQEITRLQGESTDILSSLRARLHLEDGSSDAKVLQEKLFLSEAELSNLRTNLLHDRRALIYITKQLWDFFETQEATLSTADTLNVETSTIADVILSLTSLRKNLMGLEGGVDVNASISTAHFGPLLPHPKIVALNDKLTQLTMLAKEKDDTIGQLKAELDMQVQQCASLQADLATTQTSYAENADDDKKCIEDMRVKLSEKDTALQQLTNEVTELQESVEQYRQLSVAAQTAQAQSEVRLTQYLEVSKSEMALLSSEIVNGKEAILRLIAANSVDVHVSTSDEGTQGQLAGSTRSLGHYISLLTDLVQHQASMTVELRKSLEQVQADNDTLRVANVELKRLNDVLEQPIKLKSSDPDIAAMEAKLLMLETQNMELRSERVSLQKKVYDLQGELAHHKDSLLKAHSSEELESVKLRSQLSMYADAYNILKESSLSMGQELDMLRSELGMYKTLRGNSMRASQQEKDHLDLDTSQISLAQTAHADQLSSSLFATVVRQTAMTPLMIATQKGSLRECRDNLQYTRKQLSDGMTALMFAAEAGNKEVVELLAPYECSFVRNDSTCAAELALINMHYDCAEVLREAEALKPCDTAVESLANIVAAAKGGNLLAVWSFLPTQKGMRDDDGMTALMHAALLGHRHIVPLLSAYEMKLQDNSGRTALMYAAQALNHHVITFLMSEADMQDNDGKRAVDHLPHRTDQNGASYDACFSVLT